MTLEVLASWAALLAAAGGDPVVRYEVGRALLAPPLRLGGAVLFRRQTQLGFSGAVCLGPPRDVAALLRSSWRSAAGWAGERSLTVDREHADLAAEIGARGIGQWDWMVLEEPGALVRRPLPPGMVLERVEADTAYRFVERHHTTRWLTPDPLEPCWLGLREAATGELVAIGLASATGAGATRLTSIAVDSGRRREGVGWAVTQALAEYGLGRRGAVVLGVDADNAAGLGLYPALGFRLVHRFASGSLVPASADSMYFRTGIRPSNTSNQLSERVGSHDLN
jgi:ribosomal protein S18 acetylase RimI-like enzyme